jgi:hypothetical protein
MTPDDVPTGSDLAAFMGRSDPGDMGSVVSGAVDWVTSHTVADPWTVQHTEAALLIAQRRYVARAAGFDREIGQFVYVPGSIPVVEGLLADYRVPGLA